MEHRSSWKASCSASQEILCILWKPQVHYLACENLSLAPVLC